MENNIVLGKHSGRNAFRTRLKELSYNLSDDELNRAFVRFKELADKKKDISTADLEALANDASQMITEDRYKMVIQLGFECVDISLLTPPHHPLNTPSPYYPHQVRIQVLCGDQQIPTATATIRDTSKGDVETTMACTGTGPVDAAFKVPLRTDYLTDPD